MSEFGTLLLMAICALPAFGVIWVWRRMRSGRDQQKADAARAHFIQKLRRPDFDRVEAHFGLPLPDALKSFYGSPFIECDWDIPKTGGGMWEIAYFEPLDETAVRDAWPGSKHYLILANDGFGNEYAFSPTDPASPVVFHEHETGEISRVSESLEEFLLAVKRSAPRTKAKSSGSTSSGPDNPARAS